VARRADLAFQAHGAGDDAGRCRGVAGGHDGTHPMLASSEMSLAESERGGSLSAISPVSVMGLPLAPSATARTLTRALRAP